MWHKNVSTVPVDIGGQMVPPNGWAFLEGHARQVGEHVDAGRLVPSDVTPEGFDDPSDAPSRRPARDRKENG